ncbi:MAG: hypothetical protein AAFX87_22670 [Bacteroidota bacterium]
MKLSVITIILSCMFFTSSTSDQGISQEDLKTTCSVLYQLTDKAINDNRKDLIAIYYNAYKAIRLANTITDGCDQYFDGIKTSYASDIGNWTVDLDFPPKISSSGGRGFTHREVEILQRFQELELTDKDLDQLTLFKGLQNNQVDLKTLKTTDTKEILLLNENIKKLKLKRLDESKLERFSDQKLNIEQYQRMIRE